MQYGIALRDFGMYPEAYEKLKQQMKPILTHLKLSMLLRN